jgi:hypothetical protein
MERPARQIRKTAARLAAVAVAACAAPVFSAAEPDCEALYRAHLESDLGLAYEEFDQTPGRGFRVLAMNGCSTAAADLIEAYIAINEASQRSLRWHVAQLRATAGDYPRAIASARQALSDAEDFTIRPLRWNDYVLATIAFLERDREALVRHRDRVAEGKEHPGNAMNLRLLDALVRHFDESYAYATSHIE